MFWLVVGGSIAASASAAPAPDAAPRKRTETTISLDDYVRRVFAQNENIQIRILESALEHKRYEGEKWIFEPEFFSNLEWIDSQRPNTAQQATSLFTAVFNQRDKTANSGIAVLIPTGARFQLSYSISELNNNLNTTTFPNGEFLTSVGATLTQPLLRNAGTGVNLAGIRLAALGSDSAFQQYRRGMMQALAAAETAYWDLYLAQEQYEISQESVKLASTILKDSRERVKVGKASELDVLQAESGLAERRAIENEARQRLQSANNTALDLIMETADGNGNWLVATDTPSVVATEPGQMADLQREALTMNPDYLGLELERRQNEIRLKVAKNQKLPLLDLTGGYSMSGIGTSPGASHRQTQQNSFPAWNVSLQFRLPLAGNKRARRQAESARLQLEASRLAVDGAAVEIGNLIESSLQGQSAARDSVAHYKKVVDFNEKLLETELARLEVGKTTSRVVFETESDLFESRINHLRGLALFERAVLQLHTIVGIGLDRRGMEIDKSELTMRTTDLVRKGEIDEEGFQQFVDDLQSIYRSHRAKEATDGGKPAVDKPAEKQ